MREREGREEQLPLVLEARLRLCSEWRHRQSKLPNQAIRVMHSMIVSNKKHLKGVFGACRRHWCRRKMDEAIEANAQAKKKQWYMLKCKQ